MEQVLQAPVLPGVINVSRNTAHTGMGLRSQIIELAQLPAYSMVANIGSGAGEMLPDLLLTRPRLLYAVERSGELMQSAKDTYADRGIHFVQDEFVNLIWPTLDAVILVNSYPRYAVKSELIAKLALHVRRGGIVVVAQTRDRDRLPEGLDPTWVEAKRFQPMFRMDRQVDHPDLYFMRLIRR